MEKRKKMRVSRSIVVPQYRAIEGEIVGVPDLRFGVGKRSILVSTC